MARKLRITKTDGVRYEITIPDEAQITYGNLHPGSKGGFHPSEKDDKYVLRIYEGGGVNKRQTAVFRGVDEFIDLNYELVRIDEDKFDPVMQIEKQAFLAPEWVDSEWDEITSDDTGNIVTIAQNLEFS